MEMIKENDQHRHVDPHLTSIPPDVQKIILSHLGCEEIIRMRATNIYYRDKISNNCQDIWDLQINASLWPNGKGAMNNGKNDEFMKWSRANNFNVHRKDASIEITGFEEFMRRRRLDHSVLNRLQSLHAGQGKIHTVIIGGKKYHIPGLCENVNNHNWITLMKDGDDIIDCLKRIEFPSEVSAKSKKVLTGIYRLHSYQHWKFLMAETNEPHLIETGASVIAEFYANMSQSRGCFHNIDHQIESRLCELTNAIKSSLEKRLGQSKDFPLLEVIQEMQSIFGDDSPHKFSGNATNYYDVKNSLLHEVLTRRTGIPITLAIVYAALVRRVCGAHLDLIGLPGHIVVGLPFREGTPLGEREFVDVFRGGRLLSHSDLRVIIAQYNIAWRDEMTNPIPHQEVWQRMIRNLMNCLDTSPTMPLSECNVRVIITLQSLIAPHSPIETFHDLILAPGFSAYSC